MIETKEKNDFIESYCNWMINIARDDRHGYSQKNRKLRPDIDCSSFIYYALIRGSKVSKELLGTEPFTTRTMDEKLKRIGFKRHRFNIEEIKRGDILWVKSHTEVYLGKNLRVGARRNYDQKPGDSSGKEVSIKKISNNWKYYYRYELQKKE